MRRNSRASPARSWGLPQLPDGEFLPPMEMYFVEKEVRKRLEKAFPGRNMTIGRVANLSKAGEAQLGVGRGPCQFRNRCAWGCPFGAYFSTQSSTLPAAAKTGRLTLRPDSVVTEITYDDRTQTRDRRARARLRDTAGPRVFRQSDLRLRERDRLHRAAPATPRRSAFPKGWATIPGNWAATSWITTSAPGPAARGKAGWTATTTAAGPMGSTSRATATSATTSAITCAASVTRAARVAATGSATWPSWPSAPISRTS
ncbi:MAG: hypothetical protein WDN28_13490 [Chthoniobacter sp.]